MQKQQTQTLTTLVNKQKEKQAAAKLLVTSLTQVQQASQKLSDQSAVEPPVKDLQASSAIA